MNRLCAVTEIGQYTIHWSNTQHQHFVEDTMTLSWA